MKIKRNKYVLLSSMIAVLIFTYGCAMSNQGSDESDAVPVTSEEGAGPVPASLKLPAQAQTQERPPPLPSDSLPALPADASKPAGAKLFK